MIYICKWIKIWHLCQQDYVFYQYMKINCFLGYCSKVSHFIKIWENFQGLTISNTLVSNQIYQIIWSQIFWKSRFVKEIKKSTNFFVEYE